MCAIMCFMLEDNTNFMDLYNNKIAIIGLDYVGLPLAVEFGKKYSTLGFDINQKRINELKEGYDRTLVVNTAEHRRLN